MPITDYFLLTVDQEIGLQMLWHPRQNRANEDTDEKREIRVDYICELYGEGYPIEDCCREAGVSTASFYNWFHNDPTVAAKFKSAQKRLEVVFTEIGKKAALKVENDPRYFQMYRFYTKVKFRWDDQEQSQVLLAVNNAPKPEIKQAHSYRVIENPRKQLELHADIDYREPSEGA